MNDQQLTELRRAYEASPNNAILAKLYVDAAAAAGRLREALELVARLGDSAPREQDRRPEETDAPDAPAAVPPDDDDGESPVPPPSKDRPRLRVISNDDTDELDSDRLLRPHREVKTFAHVGGLENVKEQIRKRIILPFQKPGIFERFRKRIGGGILLYGPPGCGKTLLAEATAGECNAAFFDVAISDVLDMWMGESERKLHALFEKARAARPAVLFFDEIEVIGAKRTYSRDATTSKLVSQFLAEMDGLGRKNHGVLVLGATNVPWAVDPAFRRPGRFDRVLFAPPPDRAARRAILEILLENRPHEGDLELDRLAGSTGGFSGADLEHVVECAADLAIEASLAKGAEVPISARLLGEAARDIKPTTVEWLSTARNYARYANEAGQYDEVLDFLRKHGR